MTTDVTSMITPTVAQEYCSATLHEFDCSSQYTEYDSDGSVITANVSGTVRRVQLTLGDGWRYDCCTGRRSFRGASWIPGMRWVKDIGPVDERDPYEETEEFNGSVELGGEILYNGETQLTADGWASTSAEKNATFYYQCTFDAWTKLGHFWIDSSFASDNRLTRSVSPEDDGNRRWYCPYDLTNTFTLESIRLYKDVNLTTLINPRRLGSLVGTVEGGGRKRVGDSVTVRAIPREGYRFLWWSEKYGSGDILAKDPSYTFTMPNANRTIYAHFDGTTPGIVYNPLVRGNPIAYRPRRSDDPPDNPYPIIARF